MAATLTSYSTNSYSSTLKTEFSSTIPTEETRTILGVGISTTLLIVASAVVIITVVAIIGINRRKSTKHNQDTEQQLEDGLYATLTRQEQLDATSNHPIDVIYEVLDESETIACIANGKMTKEGQMKEDEQNVKNPPNSEEQRNR